MQISLTHLLLLAYSAHAAQVQYGNGGGAAAAQQQQQAQIPEIFRAQQTNTQTTKPIQGNKQETMKQTDTKGPVKIQETKMNTQGWKSVPLQDNNAKTQTPTDEKAQKTETGKETKEEKKPHSFFDNLFGGKHDDEDHPFAKMGDIFKGDKMKDMFSKEKMDKMWHPDTMKDMFKDVPGGDPSEHLKDLPDMLHPEKMGNMMKKILGKGDDEEHDPHSESGFPFGNMFGNMFGKSDKCSYRCPDGGIPYRNHTNAVPTELRADFLPKDNIYITNECAMKVQTEMYQVPSSHKRVETVLIECVKPTCLALNATSTAQYKQCLGEMTSFQHDRLCRLTKEIGKIATGCDKKKSREPSKTEL